MLRKMFKKKRKKEEYTPFGRKNCKSWKNITGSVPKESLQKTNQHTFRVLLEG